MMRKTSKKLHQESFINGTKKKLPGYYYTRGSIALNNLNSNWSKELR